MIRSIQKFDGRRWETEEIMRAAAVYFGEMSPEERPYRKAWRARTLIASYRRDSSARPHGPGYSKEAHRACKAAVREVLQTGHLPYNVLRMGSDLIRERELAEWALYRARRIPATTPIKLNGKRINGFDPIAIDALR